MLWSHNTAVVWIAMLVANVLLPATCCGQEGVNTPPEEVVKRIADSLPRLNGSKESPRYYSCLITLEIPQKEAPAILLRFWVERQGELLSLAVYTEGGLPILFSAADETLCVNPRGAGSLLHFRGARFSVGWTPDTKLASCFRLHNRSEASDFRLDLGGVLKQALSNRESVAYHPERREVAVTERSGAVTTVCLAPVEGPGLAAIHWLRRQSSSGAAISAYGFRTFPTHVDLGSSPLLASALNSGELSEGRDTHVEEFTPQHLADFFDTKWLSIAERDEDFVRAGHSLSQKLPLSLEAEQIRMLHRAVDQFVGVTEDDDASAVLVSDKLNALEQQLEFLVIQRVGIHRLIPMEGDLVGYDRRYCADYLASWIGYERTRLLERALRICFQRLDDERAIHVVDILGKTGLIGNSRSVEQWDVDAEARGEQVRSAWSLCRVVYSVARESDVAVVQRVVKERLNPDRLLTLAMDANWMLDPNARVAPSNDQIPALARRDDELGRRACRALSVLPEVQPALLGELRRKRVPEGHVPDLIAALRAAVPKTNKIRNDVLAAAGDSIREEKYSDHTRLMCSLLTCSDLSDEAVADNVAARALKERDPRWFLCLIGLPAEQFNEQISRRGGAGRIATSLSPEGMRYLSAAHITACGSQPCDTVQGNNLWEIYLRSKDEVVRKNGLQLSELRLSQDGNLPRRIWLQMPALVRASSDELAILRVISMAQSSSSGQFIGEYLTEQDAKALSRSNVRLSASLRESLAGSLEKWIEKSIK